MIDTSFALISISVIGIPLSIILNLLFKRNLYIHVISLISLMYFAVLISVTLFPIYVDSRPVEDMRVNGSILLVNLVPFKGILSSLNHSYYMVGVRNVLGNFLLFIPFGIFLGILKVSQVLRALLYGLLFSVVIELLQLLQTHLLLGTRAVDIDDLILNSLGVVVGFLFYTTFKRVEVKYKMWGVSEKI